MTEVWTSKVYTYDFVEVVNTDYVYVATVTGYSTMSGIIYRDEYIEKIWEAQIWDYSDVIGSFANKFSNYGWVSHVIDRSSLDEESKKEIKAITDKLEEVNTSLKVAPKIETKYIESTKEIVRVEKVAIPTNDSKSTTKVIVKWLKELNNTLSSIIVKWLIEIKNNK